MITKSTDYFTKVKFTKINISLVFILKKNKLQIYVYFSISHNYNINNLHVLVYKQIFVYFNLIKIFYFFIWKINNWEELGSLYQRVTKGELFYWYQNTLPRHFN